MTAFIRWWRSLWCLTGLSCPECGRQAETGGYRYAWSEEKNLNHVTHVTYYCGKMHGWEVPFQQAGPENKGGA